MTLAINAVYHGFKVLQAQFVDEISSQAYILEHIKSGARLLYPVSYTHLTLPTKRIV